jgi:hypothetical protein
MKYIFTLLFIVYALALFGQCEDRSRAGSVSLHLTTGYRTGFGGELGTQGLLNNFSAFIGLNITYTKGYKNTDSTISLAYVKVVYRFIQNYNEDLYVAGVIAPALINTDVELQSGVRILYVTGRNTAVSAEPLWHVKEKKLFINLNIHFLL